MSASRSSKGLAASLVPSGPDSLVLTLDDAENARAKFSCPWKAKVFFTEFELDADDVARNSLPEATLAAIGEAVIVRLAVLNRLDER